MHIDKKIDYFNPFSNKFDVIKDFRNLTTKQKITTILLTFLALPLIQFSVLDSV